MPRQHLKRRKDGRYACRYKDKWFMGDTETEVLEAREAYKLQLKQGMKKDADHMTVREYAARWLPIHRSHVNNATYNHYAKQINFLVDAIGDQRVVDVTPSDIQAVYIHYQGMSQSSIQKARTLFRSIFDSAVEDGYCRTNPCRSKIVKAPKGYSGTHRAITDEERAIIHQVQHPMRLLVMVMLYAGLRRGEALALDIDRDVDFEHHIIHVRHAVQFDSDMPKLKSPKTEAGVRDVPLFSVLENELRGHHGLLFTDGTSNGIIKISTFRARWITYLRDVETIINGHKKRWHHSTKQDAMENPELHKQISNLMKAGKKQEAEALRFRDWKTFLVRTHDMRHSFCTMLRDSGVDLKMAMQWMGHADEKMILRIYDHVTEFRTSQAISQVENLLYCRQNGRQI